MAKSVEWNGRVYRSQKAAALILGVSEAAISKRVKMGWTCDEDIPERVHACPIVFKRNQKYLGGLK